jgi:peptidoglycan/xylan/chitin deacetylase (PgdA/CDA1 family)
MFGVFDLARYLTRQTLIALTYHHVLPRGAWDGAARPADAVYSDEFERQIAHLAAHHHIVKGEELQAFLQGELLPPYSVLITFDDGYRDNYTEAFPILQRYRASAVFFVATGLVDDPLSHPWLERLDSILRVWSHAEFETWLDASECHLKERRPAALRRYLKYCNPDARNRIVDSIQRHGSSIEPVRAEQCNPMTWDQLRAMSAAGMTIGGHTVSHQILSAASVDQVRDEISGCRNRIETEVQKACWAFSYPNGSAIDFRAADERLLREGDYRCAFTQVEGLITRQSNPFRLPRIPVPGTEELFAFQSRSSGLVALLRGRGRFAEDANVRA